MTLPVIAGVQYEWQNGTLSPQYQITRPGTYWVRATNSYCNLADTLIVTMENCADMPYVPNVFTPNGDGLNGWFRVSGNVPSMMLQVYNRWGRKLFETNNISSWDGRRNGKPAPEGACFYNIQLIDRLGLTHRIKGTVVLLR